MSLCDICGDEKPDDEVYDCSCCGYVFCCDCGNTAEEICIECYERNTAASAAEGE